MNGIGIMGMCSASDSGVGTRPPDVRSVALGRDWQEQSGTEQEHARDSGSRIMDVQSVRVVR